MKIATQTAIIDSFGEQLSEIEIKVIEGSTQNVSYAEMARTLGYSRQYLSNDLGPRLWKKLTEILGVDVSKKNIRQVVLDKYSLSPAHDSENLSSRERLEIVQALNSCSQSTFKQLLFVLNVPRDLLDVNESTRSDVVASLLQWVESAEGVGLSNLQTLLEKVAEEPCEAYDSKSFSFAISGCIDNASRREVEAIVSLLKKKVGDSSIDVVFFEEG